MREKNQWLAAFAGSGLVHIALLFLLGSFAGGLLAAVPAEEKYIEIELFAPSAGSGGQAGIVKAAAAAPREPDSGPAHAAASAVAREAVAPFLSENFDNDNDAVPASIAAGPAAGLAPGPAAGQGSKGGAGAAGGAGLTGGSGAPAASGTGQGSGMPARNGKIMPPAVIVRVEPEYPEAARRSGAEGTVLLRLTILESGRLADVRVERSSGHPDLDAAATAAVRQWRFAPAREEDSGRSVACVTTLPVAFRLR